MCSRANVLCLALLLFAAIVMRGQEPRKPLTNGDIIRLVQAETPDQTIILVIAQSRTHFDTSPEGLISLRKGGVSKAVIDAMLGGAPKSSASSATQKGLAVDIPKQNLGDEFAKAGLKALRSIEATLASPGVSGASITVPRVVQELIDDADADARTEDEKAVVGSLNKFFIGRLMNNLQREVIKPGSYNAESEVWAQKVLENDPRNKDFNAREAACSGALESILRGRHFSEKPAACDEVSPPTAAKKAPGD
jgi:hypothetical protein